MNKFFCKVAPSSGFLRYCRNKALCGWDGNGAHLTWPSLVQLPSVTAPTCILHLSHSPFILQSELLFGSCRSVSVRCLNPFNSLSLLLGQSLVLLTKPSMTEVRVWQTFSVKGQTVNILSFGAYSLCCGFSALPRAPGCLCTTGWLSSTFLTCAVWLL